MKRSDNASPSQSELLARIVVCNNDALFSVDQGRITSWNKGAERLYGYSVEEALGQMFVPCLWPTAVADAMAYLYERLMVEKRITDIETYHVGKDGTHIPVLMNLSLLTDEAAMLQGMAISVRAMSERNPAQALGISRYFSRE